MPLDTTATRLPRAVYSAAVAGSSWMARQGRCNARRIGKRQVALIAEAVSSPEFPAFRFRIAMEEQRRFVEVRARQKGRKVSWSSCIAFQFFRA
ncbi:hypothetical protein VXQ18_00250 [Brucella abortus]|nr:hypothetical protein [Brucella abortus]